MKNRRLDADWDYCFGRGKSDYLEGVEACAQAIKSRILLLLGEWWEDKEDGLPLWQRILGTQGTPNNIRAVDLIYRDRISGAKGVLAILNYESEFKNRKYVFKAVVETLYGALVVSSEEVGA